MFTEEPGRSGQATGRTHSGSFLPSLACVVDADNSPTVWFVLVRCCIDLFIEKMTLTRHSLPSRATIPALP